MAPGPGPVPEAGGAGPEIAGQTAPDGGIGRRLATREELAARLERVGGEPLREGTGHILFHLDLDRFAVVNETCGVVGGDELLGQIGARLREQVRGEDLVARIDCDRFAILLAHCPVDRATPIGEELRRAVEAHQFVWNGCSLGLTASVGLFCYTDTGLAPESILNAGERACAAAKDLGGNRIQVYRCGDRALDRRHGELRWAGRISAALAENRFRLWFQEIVPTEERPAQLELDLHARHRIEGPGPSLRGEILLRMEDESGALVAPGEFLPAAERCRLTPRVDRWVVSSALDWFSRHPALLERLRLLTINLSGHSLGDEGFTEFVLRRVRDSALEPELICFEITETAAVRNLAEARALMTALRKVGCRFALDDFGSGLCSFAYLRSLPADYLKIAGLFVKDIERSAVDLALVRSINEVAHVMGKQTIAEFVESDTVRSCLQGIGVDYVQGYGIGWPRPIESLLGHADAGRVREAWRVPEPSPTFGSFACQGGRS